MTLVPCFVRELGFYFFVMENDRSITVSSALTGKGVQKLKVLYCDRGVLALEKPAGMLIDAYPWYEDTDSIVASLKREGLKKQPELATCQLSSIYSVYSLEPEITGVAVLTTDKETSAFLRNELGSGKFIFKFVLLAKSELQVSSIECDLPLAKHYTENRVIVSNKTGKKCKTVFNLMATSGPYQLWEAQTDYVRMHQIRVHAMERGIHIIGEELYTEADSPRSVAYKATAGKKLEKKLVCNGLCVHLHSVAWEQGGTQVVVSSPLPQRMEDILSKSQSC